MLETKKASIAADETRNSDKPGFKLSVLDFAHWLELWNVKPARRTGIETCGKKYYGAVVIFGQKEDI